MKYKNYLKLLFIISILSVSCYIVLHLFILLSSLFVFLDIDINVYIKFVLFGSLLTFFFIKLINTKYNKKIYYKIKKINIQEIFIFLFFVIIAFFIAYIQLFIKNQSSYSLNQIDIFISKMKSNFPDKFYLLMGISFGVWIEEFFFRKLYLNSIMKYQIKVNIHYLLLINLLYFTFYHFPSKLYIPVAIIDLSFIICFIKFLDYRINIILHTFINVINFFLGYINRNNPYIYEIAKLSMNKNFQIIFKIFSIIFFIIFYLYYAKDLKNWSDNIIVDRKMENKNINTSNKNYVVKAINGFIKK